DVVRPRGTTADADPPPASRKPAVRGALGDGEIEALRYEALQLRAALRLDPTLDDGRDAFAQGGVLEDAAIEEDCGRVHERGTRALRCAAGAAQECRQVARDGGVLRVGQSERRQSDAALRRGRGGDRNVGEEAFHDVAELAPRQLGPDRPTPESAAT